MNNRLVSTLFFLGIFVGFLNGQSVQGTIKFTEGSVKLLRKGTFISPSRIKSGFILQESDTLETNETGYVEIEMNAPQNGSLIKVLPETVFYFESVPQKKKFFQTTLTMLRGTLRIKSKALTPGESFRVQTNEALMGVRGTEFSVDISPDRMVLLSVLEGKVESKTNRGSSSTTPGTVTIINTDNTLENASVPPEEIDLYRAYWKKERLKALEINAKLSIEQFSRQWAIRFPIFKKAIRKLESHRSLFNQWDRIIQNGKRTPPLSKVIRDKRTLSPGMLALRAILPITERTYETLLGLESFYKANQADGPFQEGPYKDARDFYSQFNRDSIRVQKMLSSARWMFKTYRFIDKSSGISSGVDLMDIMGDRPKF